MAKSPIRPLPPNRITRAQLAELLHISQRTIGRWEAKGIAPTQPVFMKVRPGQLTACYALSDVELYRAWAKMHNMEFL